MSGSYPSLRIFRVISSTLLFVSMNTILLFSFSAIISFNNVLSLQWNAKKKKNIFLTLPSWIHTPTSCTRRMLRILRMGSTHWMGGHRRHYIHISCTSHKHSCSADNTAEACQDRREEIQHVALKKLAPNVQSAITANTISETDDNQLTSAPFHIPDTHQWSEECCDLQTAVVNPH